MKFKLINDQQQRTFALVFKSGEEVMENMKHFAEENKLCASQFSAIGAFSEATLGFFDFNIKDYKKIMVQQQVEVLAINGDITIYKNEHKIHAHAVLGKADGSTAGGHLINARVHPTLEVILTESPAYLQRKTDAETGLALIDL